MKNILKILLLIITIIGLVACKGNKIQNNGEVLLNGSLVKKDEAKALQIEAFDEYTRDSNGVVVNRVENIANFDVSNIWIVYNELDKEGKIISEAKMFLDMTLKPGDIFNASFKLKESGENISITSYEYMTSEEDVTINLKDGSVYSVNIDDKEEDSSPYEVLAFSDAKKVDDADDGDTYIVKMKNNSSKSLGNITLKIGEINSKKEYIGVNHESSYSALKPLQEAEIMIKVSNHTEKIKLIGYVYDDIDEKSNIDIDLISHKAQINKN